MRTEIIEAAARAFFVDDWARRQEEKKGFRGFGGEELMDMAPATTRTALTFGRKFIAEVERLNGAKIEALYEHAERLALAPGGMRYARQKPNPDLFGHYLAMQALGSGVGWSDDYPDHGLDLPRVEFYSGRGSMSGITTRRRGPRR